MIVKSYQSELFWIINLESEVDEGEFPLFDLYRKHGRIVFQLFAACNVCDFSEHASGIPYLGFDSFIRLVKCLKNPSVSTLASNRAMILCKAQASMIRDEKTRNNTDKDGHLTKKQEYLLIMEMEYQKSDQIENGHNLGIFSKMLRSYCTKFVAGQGNCRRKSEWMWYQYHHWTDERLGIDRPCALDACSWAPGGKVLNLDIGQTIHEQQTVKHAKTVEDQSAKMKRGGSGRRQAKIRVASNSNCELVANNH